MPNYANNYGTIVAHNKAGEQLIQEWAKAYKDGNDEENERNFCDVFVPEPKWDSFIDGEGALATGGWNHEKVWVKLLDGTNRKLTDVEKKRMADAEITEDIIGSYDFCSHVWGTKWGLCDGCVEWDSKSITFSGSTAWGPFGQMWVNVVDALNIAVKRCKAEGKEVPEIYVLHDFDEQGCDFAGRIQVQMVGDEDAPYEYSEEEFTYEEAIDAYDGDHSTLPDADDYFYQKKEWTGHVYEGNLNEVNDADLVFCDEGKPIILVPSHMNAYYVGQKLEIVKHPSHDEFYVA